MSDPIEKAHLVTAHRQRVRTRLLDATDLLAAHWTGAQHPPREPGPRHRAVPASRPPTPIGPTSTRDAAWRDLRSWCQMVMEERDLTEGPRDTGAVSLAMFLARHADWIAAHEAGQDCADELAGHARRIRDLDRGYHARRFQLGPCVEDVHDDAGIETWRCEGNLWALMRQEDDLLPDKVACDVTVEHVWRPGQWPALGRRMGQTIAASMEREMGRLSGHTSGRIGA